MQFSKVAISLLLLLTYSFGFAHALIPHQEKNDLYNQDIAIQEIEHRHQHHDHLHNENVAHDHAHISHENHFDESLFDLIACFLCELEYPTNICEIQHYIPVRTNEDANQKFSKTNLVALLFAFVVGTGQIEPKPEYNEKSNNYSSALTLKNAPLRGPPSLT